ncbi:hypothetical protein [Streptomyces sp. SID10815]|uniref:hypothetical protein n=1 Tax=Streptomyces sp. SID10815 TaxID=2706027 RepID=UPI0013CCB2F8|nr:hypothetical protein [Streptomyces sp. SID10815]NEA49361.1 hypothetical protein [Streptomyces sp. SID10815]
MTETSASQLAELRGLGLLPAEPLCVFQAGSIVRGWGNPTSDVDLFVITDGAWTAPVATAPIPLGAGVFQAIETYVDGTRCDIRLLTDAQVDAVLAKVSHDAFESAVGEGVQLDRQETVLLEWLRHGVALETDEWLKRRADQLASSAFGAVLVQRGLNYADSRVEDAVGQMSIGDLESAVLSAHVALGYAVDALLASCGEYGQNPKWRARRFRAVEQSVLTFEEYWKLQTMQTFDPADPAAWVDEVLPVCRKISMEVVL